MMAYFFHQIIHIFEDAAGRSVNRSGVASARKPVETERDVIVGTMTYKGVMALGRLGGGSFRGSGGGLLRANLCLQNSAGRPNCLPN